MNYIWNFSGESQKVNQPERAKRVKKAESSNQVEENRKLAAENGIPKRDSVDERDDEVLYQYILRFLNTII